MIGKGGGGWLVNFLQPRQTLGEVWTERKKGRRRERSGYNACLFTDTVRDSTPRTAFILRVPAAAKSKRCFYFGPAQDNEEKSVNWLAWYDGALQSSP